jgi:hypothetical protein
MRYSSVIACFCAQVITGSAKPKFFEHEREPIYEARHVGGQLRMRVSSVSVLASCLCWRARQRSNKC